MGGQLGAAAAPHLLLSPQRRGAGRLGGAAAGEYLRLSGERAAWPGEGGYEAVQEGGGGTRHQTGCAGPLAALVQAGAARGLVLLLAAVLLQVGPPLHHKIENGRNKIRARISAAPLSLIF